MRLATKHEVKKAKHPYYALFLSSKETSILADALGTYPAERDELTSPTVERRRAATNDRIMQRASENRPSYITWHPGQFELSCGEAHDSLKSYKDFLTMGIQEGFLSRREQRQQRKVLEMVQHMHEQFEREVIFDEIHQGIRRDFEGV